MISEAWTTLLLVGYTDTSFILNNSSGHIFVITKWFNIWTFHQTTNISVIVTFHNNETISKNKNLVVWDKKISEKILNLEIKKTFIAFYVDQSLTKMRSKFLR